MRLLALSLLLAVSNVQADQTLEITCKNQDKENTAVLEFDFAITDKEVDGWLRGNSSRLEALPNRRINIGKDETKELTFSSSSLKREVPVTQFKLSWGDVYSFYILIVYNGEQGGNATIVTATDGAVYSDRFECSID